MKALPYVLLLAAFVAIGLTLPTRRSEQRAYAGDGPSWALQLADSELAAYQLGMADRVAVATLGGIMPLSFTLGNGRTVTKDVLRTYPSEWIRGNGPTDTLDIRFTQTPALESQLVLISQMFPRPQVVLCISGAPLLGTFAAGAHVDGWLVSDAMRPSLTGVIVPIPDSLPPDAVHLHLSDLRALAELQSAESLLYAADVVLVGTAADSFSACTAGDRQTLCQDVQIDSVLFGEESASHVLVTGYSYINWQGEPLVLYLKRESVGVYSPVLLATGVVPVRNGQAEKLGLDLSTLATMIRNESLRIRPSR